MGKYIIKNTETGIRFDLYGSNGRIIANSEVYTSLAACKNGIESIGKTAPDAPVEYIKGDGSEALNNPKFVVYTDKAGQYRFRLRAVNGEIIASSEGYVSKRNCEKGIASVKRNAQSPAEDKRNI